MKTLLYRLAGSAALIAAICSCTINTVQAEKWLSQEQQVARQAALRGMTAENMVDSLVRVLDFQFIPGNVDGQLDGKYAIYKFRNTPGFPLWLMINMGGPLTVNKRIFTVNRIENKVKDDVRVWLVNLSCADSVNGKFDLQFVIEAATGKTVLEVTQTEKGVVPPPESETNRNQGSFMFQGYIFPEYLIYTYQNDKQKERARQTEEQLDLLVPRLDFSVGGMTVNPTLLERRFATLVYLDKHNDMWYIRFEFPAERNRNLKISVEDFAINARTGETFIRAGSYDYLEKNWMHSRWRNTVFTNSN